MSLRDLPATVAQLIDASTDHPFPGRTLARHWSTPGGVLPDPVLSQLENPSLRGEDFRTENVTCVNSLIYDNHILIESRNQPLELYHLVNDPLQQHNLAGLSSERTRTARLTQMLDDLRSGLSGTPEPPAPVKKGDWSRFWRARRPLHAPECPLRLGAAIITEVGSCNGESLEHSAGRSR